MRIHCLQHVPFEGPAAIANWAADRGHPLAISRLDRGEGLPSPDAFDRLVVMGGPMGVGDEAEHPWLPAEKALLRRSIDAGRSVVGICLGAQLLAEVLGARVYRGAHKEIGWFPIELTDRGPVSPVFAGLPRRLEVFHWHGDTFDLPSGAQRLASSAACLNQAFLHGERVLGLQFHLESTPESVRAIVANCADELTPARWVQTAGQMLGIEEDAFAAINDTLFGVLDRLPG
jgi:GMP synthase-like glutamine amidotransferase